MINQIKLNIGGVTYTVKSDENAEYLSRLGYELEQRIKNISRKNPTLSTATVAVIAALEASDEANKAKEELRILKEKDVRHKPQQPNNRQMRLNEK